MRVYRETRAVTRPPELVARAIEARCGPPTGGSWRWTYRRFGVYAHEVRLDPGSGEVHATVRVPGWLRALSLAALPAVVALLAADAPPGAFLLALWVAALAVLVPLAHLWPGVPAGPPAVDGAEVVDRRVTAHLLPAVAAVLLALWAALRGTAVGGVAAPLAAALFAVAAGSYAVTDGLGRAGTTLAPLGVAVSGALPVLLAAANVLVARALLADPRHPALAVALSVGCALALTAVLFAYARAVADSLAESRLAPLRSRTLRGGGLLALAVLHLGLLSGVGWGLVHLATAPPPGLARVLAPLGPAAPAGGVAFALVLGAPVCLLGAWWVGHLARLLRAWRAVRTRAERVSVPGIPDDVTVLALGDAPVARPAVGLPGRAVVVGRPLLADLAADELAAVVAHEAHHLRRRERWRRRLATALGPLCGGRNALLAFTDAPAAELAADDRAAAVAGPDALVRALRRVETLRGPAAGTDRRRGAAALFFGPLLLDRAHASVDRRVERLLADGGDRNDLA